VQWLAVIPDALINGLRPGCPAGRTTTRASRSPHGQRGHEFARDGGGKTNALLTRADGLLNSKTASSKTEVAENYVTLRDPQRCRIEGYLLKRATLSLCRSAKSAKVCGHRADEPG